MLFRRQVRSVVVELLTAALTGAGAKVESSKDQSVAAEDLPLVAVYTDDRKQSQGDGGNIPEFTTMVTTTIELRGVGATKDLAEEQMDALCEAVENALLGAPAFTGLFEKVESVETLCDYHGEANKNHIFLAAMEIKGSCTERFEPVIPDSLRGLNIYVDTVNRFDSQGTYEPPFAYPVADAPRPSGPDGRVEASMKIDIPE